jgi:hypothetical protein
MALLLVRQEDYAARGYAYDVIGDTTGHSGQHRAQSSGGGDGHHTKHIPGDDNVQCVGLSRGKSGPEVGLPADLSVVLKEDAVQYIRLCDPTDALIKAEQHVGRSRELLGVLRGQHTADNN